MREEINLSSLPLLGTFFMYLSFLYLYLFNFINGIVFVLLLIILIVFNVIFMGLSINVRPVYRSFILAGVFVFSLFLYESPLFFGDRSKTKSYLYIPTEEVVSDTGIYIISIASVELSEKGKVFMQSELDLLKVIQINNFHRYTSKNNFIFEFLHIAKDEDVEMADNLEYYAKGAIMEIKEYLSRREVTGASSGLALALSALIKEKDWNDSMSVAVTGAIDREGNVLGVGLVREKVLTAARDGHAHIIVPAENLEEALQTKEESNLSMVVYGARSVEDAIEVIEKWNGY